MITTTTITITTTTATTATATIPKYEALSSTISAAAAHVARRGRRRRERCGTAKVELMLVTVAVMVAMALIGTVVASSEVGVMVRDLERIGSGRGRELRDVGLEEEERELTMVMGDRGFTPLLTPAQLFEYAMGSSVAAASSESTGELDQHHHNDDDDDDDDDDELSSSLVRRQQVKWPPSAERATVTIRNGVVRPQNILWNWYIVHKMQASELLRDPDTSSARNVKRQSSSGGGGGGEMTLTEPKLVRLTFNTCQQPLANMSDIAEGRSLKLAPQLQVYVSNSTQNQAPGPGVQGKAQMRVPIDRGWGHLEFEASSDIYIGVSAPELPDSDVESTWQHNPPWNYELSVTTGEPYHGYVDDQFLYLVDTDDSAALFITGNMTSESALFGGVNETLSDDELMATRDYPYTMYAQTVNKDANALRVPFAGIEKSYCAVRQLAQAKPARADISMTTRGLGKFPKQQFHLRELNRSTEYYGYLARPRNTSNPSDTGGTLWQPTGFTTKNDGNCRIIYNLPFCSEVAYAVPANPTVFSNAAALTSFYDDHAKKWWKNFTYSLQQIQCNASSSASYSLVRNCDNCAASYKNWLCAVTIPRCMDFSSNLSYLAERSADQLFWNATVPGWQEGPHQPVIKSADATPRNATTPRTRNAVIDEAVMPGRYKEVKPCRDLCWSLVQDCPTSLGFSCPNMRSETGIESYGERDPTGDVTCSYLGAVYFLNKAGRTVAGMSLWMWGLVLAVGTWIAV